MAKEWTTSRLRIRRFRVEDWERLYELQGDPEATFFIGGPWTLEKTRDVTKRIVANYEVKDLEWFAVADLQTDVVMGACWLGPMDRKWCEALGIGPQIELGFRYARKYWGKGYAAEAGWAMLKRGFEEMGLWVITAIVDVRNGRSERVLQKLGMKRGDEAERDGVRVRFYSIGRKEMGKAEAGLLQSKV